MKIYRPFNLIIVFLATVFIVSACKKDDNPVSSNSDDLVGTWVLTKITVPSYNNAELSPDDVGTHATFVLRSDKSFTVTTVDSSGTEVQTGTWGAADGKVTLKSDTSTVVMPYTLSGNKLTVETTYTIEPFGEVFVKLELTKQ